MKALFRMMEQGFFNLAACMPVIKYGVGYAI